jgi:hypothetical protein
MSARILRSITARELSCLLAAFAMAGFWLVMTAGLAKHSMRTDFLNLYTGASLARDGQFGNLHDPSIQLARERELVQSVDRLIPFVRPHAYALLLSPMSLLPLQSAFVLWIAIQFLVMAAVAWWAWRTYGADALIWCAMFPPVGLGINHGQDNALILGILVAGWGAMVNGRDRLAGAIWSLLLIKFHLLLGLGAAILLFRRRRVWEGLAAGGFLFGAVTLALAGGTGMVSYGRMLTNRDSPGLYPGVEKLANLQGIAACFHLPEAAVYASLGSIILLLALVAARGGNEETILAVSVAAALLLTPHVYIYDWSLLLLPLVAVHASVQFGPTRWMSASMLSPFVTIATLANPPWCAMTPIALLVWLAVAAGSLRRRPTVTAPVIARV